MDREDSGEESPEDPADGISGNEYPRSLGGVLGCQVVVGSCERERGDRCERDACGKSGDEEHGEGGGEDAEGVECGAGDEGGGEGASPAEAGVGVDPGDDAGGEAGVPAEMMVAVWPGGMWRSWAMCGSAAWGA